MRGKEPFRQEILQYPYVNLVVQKGKTRIYGVVKGKSVQVLEGRGKVLGVLFHPGGFRPFYGRSVCELTDRSVECSSVFGEETFAAERDILSADNDQQVVTRVEQFLRRTLPEPDKLTAFINRIVDGIVTDRDIIKVDEAAGKFRISKRTLQRLFKEYVGVSPKWIVQRSRIQEAALLAAKGNNLNWAKLAAELGYFDQSHFMKDFKPLSAAPLNSTQDNNQGSNIFQGKQSSSNEGLACSKEAAFSQETCVFRLPVYMKNGSSRTPTIRA